MKPILHASCPACWSPLAPGSAACSACGHATQAPRRAPLWIGLVLGAIGGATGTWWLVGPATTPPRDGVPAPTAPAPSPSPARLPASRPEAHHTVGLYDDDGVQVGVALLLHTRPGASVIGLLPISRLPLRSGLHDGARNLLTVTVLAIADAYGFVLLQGLLPEGAAPLVPRRAPIRDGETLVVAGSDHALRVLGRTPLSPNDLELDTEWADGAALVDGDGMAAGLTLGGRLALSVTPVWSWFDAPPSPQTLPAAQALLRSRDPSALLADAITEINDAREPETTRSALERLEVGFAMARGAELVTAYDRALRTGHRLLAQRLSRAGLPREGFAHARSSLRRFIGDVDLLADAVVLAAEAGDFLAACEMWFELRSRDADRAQSHAAGLIAALTRAADARAATPGEAIALLTPGVEVFPDHAALRMRYAEALLASGDADAALWQARIAAERDATLVPRWQSLAARRPASGGAVEIPIDPETNIVRTACSVAGRSIELVVDTGATITVLPLEFLSMGTRTGRRVRVQTVSGEVEADLVRIGELRIGSITVHQILAAAIDLPGTLAGRGLLGMNVLRRLNMRLDSGRGVMTLHR